MLWKSTNRTSLPWYLSFSFGLEEITFLLDRFNMQYSTDGLCRSDEFDILQLQSKLVRLLYEEFGKR